MSNIRNPKTVLDDITVTQNTTQEKDKEVFDLPYTDAGNAESFALTHGHLLRFVHGVGWHYWDGFYWKPDVETKVMQAVKCLSRYRQLLVTRMEKDTKPRIKKLAAAIETESIYGAKRCLEFSESLEPFSVIVDDCDNDPMLLATPNGTVNLKTAILQKPEQTDLITLSTRAIYDPKADCPRWKQFLKQIIVLPDGKTTNFDLINYLQRGVGYSITANTSERCFFLCHGNGANGKSTFINVIAYVVGTYADTIKFSKLMIKKFDSDDKDNDLAALRSRRFVSAIEADKTRTLNEELIKSLTGNKDPIKCRFLRQEFFNYIPVYKIWLACNDIPKITGTDEGIWDRIKIIPFNARFEKNAPETDKDLYEKLIAEAPGILNWIIQGAKMWVEQGLNDCDTVKDAVRQFRSEEDVLSDFLLENVLAAPGSFVTSTDLFNRYNDWATQNGNPKVSNAKILGRDMVKRKYKTGVKNNKRGYLDIALI